MVRSSARSPLPRSEGHRPAKTLPELMASYERLVLIQAVQLNGGSRTRAAESLGISRMYFYRRARALRIAWHEIPRLRGGRPSKKGEQVDG